MKSENIKCQVNDNKELEMEMTTAFEKAMEPDIMIAMIEGLQAENKRLREALEVIDKSDGFCTIKEIILHVRHVLKVLK